MLDIVILPDDRLYDVSSPVRNIDGELAQYCERMIKAMHAHDGIGLAGVQTGRLENIFVVHVPEDVARVFINPEILAVSDNYLSYEEGCLSIPGVYADVDRPDGVEIRAWDQKGKEFTLPAEGLLAGRYSMSTIICRGNCSMSISVPVSGDASCAAITNSTKAAKSTKATKSTKSTKSTKAINKLRANENTLRRNA